MMNIIWKPYLKHKFKKLKIKLIIMSSSSEPKLIIFSYGLSDWPIMINFTSELFFVPSGNKDSMTPPTLVFYFSLVFFSFFSCIFFYSCLFIYFPYYYYYYILLGVFDFWPGWNQQPPLMCTRFFLNDFFTFFHHQSLSLSLSLSIYIYIYIYMCIYLPN
jgi:hypothetical protein